MESIKEMISEYKNNLENYNYTKENELLNKQIIKYESDIKKLNTSIDLYIEELLKLKNKNSRKKIDIKNL